jgi:pyridoxamine 5'-phosphate oxidase-like protein
VPGLTTSRYLVLATADATGRPWSTPVYFAHLDFAEFFWVSPPGAAHSRNIAVRPEVGIVASFAGRCGAAGGNNVETPHPVETSHAYSVFSFRRTKSFQANGRPCLVGCVGG